MILSCVISVSPVARRSALISAILVPLSGAQVLLSQVSSSLGEPARGFLSPTK